VKCPDCGGRGWIIIERGGLSGAERCSCSKPPVVPGADDPPEFPDFMEAAIHISMTVRRFPKKDAKLLDIVARQLERFVSTKDQLEWVKEAAGMEMESWHLGELRRIFCQQFEPKDKIYFNDSPEKAEMRGIEAAGEVCQGRSESFPPRRRKRGPLLCLAESFFLMFSFDFGGGWSGALRRP